MNVCESSPCQNGGFCSVNALDFVAYSCICPYGFAGINCETTIDVCISRPCLNGGTCLSSSASFTCLCPTGYNGTTCQTCNM